MRCAMLLPIVMLSVLPAVAQPDAFDQYILTLRDHHQPQDLSLFAKECGIHGTVVHRFAFGNGGWEVTRNLPKDVYGAESDSLATADVWVSEGRPVMVVTWVTDAYLAQERVACLDENEKVTSQKTTSWSCDGKDCDRVSINSRLDSTWQLVRGKAMFFSSHGAVEPLTPELLDKESYEFSTQWKDFHSLSDFELPSQLCITRKKETHATP